jgi:plastocyanin
MNGIRELFTERRRPMRDNCPAIVEALESRALLATVTVHVENFQFNPDPVTINVGDTVHWVFDTGNHSTTSVKGSAVSWDSGVLNTGATFDETFNQGGTFVYYCKIHGSDNGNGTASGMASKVVVVPAGSPTPSPSPSPTPTPSPSITPLTATGQNAKGKVNKAIHPQVARFSERNAKPGNFMVTIDWGDNSAATTGKIRTAGKNKFAVVGNHRYTAPGVYQVMTMIMDQSGQMQNVVSTATVTGKVKAAHR